MEITVRFGTLKVVKVIDDLGVTIKTVVDQMVRDDFHFHGNYTLQRDVDGKVFAPRMLLEHEDCDIEDGDEFHLVAVPLA